MSPGRSALLALAATGCVLTLAGCSFEGDVTTASGATSATRSTSHSSHSSTASTTTAPISTTSTTTASTTTASTTTAGSSTPTTTAAGSSTPTTTAAGSAAGETPSGGGASATDRCHSGGLVGRLATEDSSAGHRHATIELRNISGRTCRVYGYGGLQLVDEFQQALPTRQVRQPAPPPAVVTVPPGGSVTSQLTWAVVPGDQDATSGPCQPEPTTLAVIPPDETQPLSIAWNRGSVCQGGAIQQQAYR